MNALRKLLTSITTPVLKLLMGPLHVVTTPHRVFGMSLPRRAGVFVFLMLAVLAAVCFFVAQKQDPTHKEPFHKEKFLAIVGVLIVLTPIVVEYMVKTWLDHDVSEFPDIDEAWTQGLAKLREAALSLSDLPLFLVLGSPDEEQTRALMNSSTLNLTVNSEPGAGPSALRWFAGPDAAVLFVSNACCLSRLAVKAGEPPTASVPQQDVRTMTPPLEEPGRVARTVEVPENFTFDRTAMSQMPRSMMSAPSRPAYMGVGTVTPGWEEPEEAVAGHMFAPVTLTNAEIETATARLEHVCRLLLKERLPLCPINGILLVLPFELIARGEQETTDLCNSAKADLATLRTFLQLRCQAIALFGGMEQLDGFTELMRRLGPKVTKEQQFGKGYNPRCYPARSELSAVAQHACGSFEDFTNHLLLSANNERRSNPRGNRQLYSLVCRIRALQQRVEYVIVNAFAGDG